MCSFEALVERCVFCEEQTFFGGEWSQGVLDWGQQGSFDIKCKLASRVLISVAQICCGTTINWVEGGQTDWKKRQ